jgi:hypothetical protein
MVGLAFNPFSTDSFYSIGGGSSNLLGTWTVFFTLCVIYFEKTKTNRFIFYTFSFLLLLLSQSRGGLLSFMLTLIASFFIQKKPFSGFITMCLILFGFIFFYFYYFSSIELSTSLPILTRLLDSYKEGSFDGSSAARFENYFDIFKIWFSNPVYFMFGLGFDEYILLKITGWSLVESFYLSLLFCGGLISFFIFLYFAFVSYIYRNVNHWFGILFIFIFLNSIINWSITGSDILSVVGLFPILMFSTLGLLKKNS